MHEITSFTKEVLSKIIDKSLLVLLKIISDEDLLFFDKLNYIMELK